MIFFDRLICRLMFHVILTIIVKSASHCDEYRELSMATQGDNFIFSPNFPHRTPKNSTCTYTYTCTLNKAGRLCLHFLQFNLNGALDVEAQNNIEIRIGKARYYQTGANEYDSVSTNELLLPRNLNIAPLCFQWGLITRLQLTMSTSSVSKGFFAKFKLHNVVSKINSTTCSIPCIGDRYVYTDDGQRTCDCKSAEAAPCVGSKNSCYGGYCQPEVCNKNISNRNCVKDWFGMSSSNTYAWWGCADKVSCTFENNEGQCSLCGTNLDQKFGSLRITRSDHSRLDRLQRCILISQVNTGKNTAIALAGKSPFLKIALTEFKEAHFICFRFWWRSQALKTIKGNYPKIFLVIAQTDMKFQTSRLVLSLHGYMSNYIDNKEHRVWNKAEIDINPVLNSTLKDTVIHFYAEATQKENIVNRNVFDIDDLSVLPGHCMNYQNTIGACSFETSSCGWISSRERNWTHSCKIMDHTYARENGQGCAWTLPLNPKHIKSFSLYTFESAIQTTVLNQPHCLTMWYKLTNGQLKIYSIGTWQIQIINVLTSLTSSIEYNISSTTDSSGWTFLWTTSPIVAAQSFNISIGFQVFEPPTYDFGLLLVDDVSISVGECNKTLYFITDCDPKSFYRCSNQNCINASLRCNGIDDCGDNSDEVNVICQKSYLPQLLTAIGLTFMCVILLGLWGKACESKIMRYCHFGSQRRVNQFPPRSSSIASSQLEQAFELQARRNDEQDVNCSPPTYAECMQQQYFTNQSFKCDDDLPPPDYPNAIFMTDESERSENPNATIVNEH